MLVWSRASRLAFGDASGASVVEEGLMLNKIENIFRMDCWGHTLRGWERGMFFSTIFQSIFQRCSFSPDEANSLILSCSWARGQRLNSLDSR